MVQCVARTRVRVTSPETIIDELCEHLVEHGAEVRRSEGSHIVTFRGAEARLSPEAGMLDVDAKAGNLEQLYFLRMTVASHILEFSHGAKPVIEWSGDGAELMRPPNFQMLTVAGVRNITPHMRRIKFAAEHAERFVGMDALHINLLFQHPDRREPQWPRVGSDGLIAWDDPATRPFYRKYTVRRVDAAAGTLDVDFVVHADAGPGSHFATAAQPGDRIGVVGPGGGGLVEADWYLFAGDETALPAIGRMLEHLPATARGTALIAVADAAEIQTLVTKADIEVIWLLRGRAGRSLADAVRSIEMPAAGTSIYAWAGCEFNDFRAIRAHFRTGLNLGKHQHLAVSYWRKGNAENEAD